MSDVPTNFEQLIDTWGIAKFADAIGVSYSTANAWKQRNSVPPKHWEAIIEKAPRKYGVTERRIIQMGVRAGKVAPTPQEASAA